MTTWLNARSDVTYAAVISMCLVQNYYWVYRARLILSRMCSRNFCSTQPLHFWHFSIRNICMPVECVCGCVCRSVSVTAFSCDHTSDECSSSMTGSEAEATGRETEAVGTRGRREEEDWHRGGAVPGRETQSGHRESKTAAVLSDRPSQGTSCECLWYITVMYNIFEVGRF